QRAHCTPPRPRATTTPRPRIAGRSGRRRPAPQQARQWCCRSRHEFVTRDAICNIRARMATGEGRDLRELSQALESWTRQHFPDRDGLGIRELERASAGWTNEILLADVEWTGGDERLVFRVPAETASFPDTDPVREGHVHDALRAHGVPAPEV